MAHQSIPSTFKSANFSQGASSTRSPRARPTWRRWLPAPVAARLHLERPPVHRVGQGAWQLQCRRLTPAQDVAHRRRDLPAQDPHAEDLWLQRALVKHPARITLNAVHRYDVVAWLHLGIWVPSVPLPDESRLHRLDEKSGAIRVVNINSQSAAARPVDRHKVLAFSLPPLQLGARSLGGRAPGERAARLLLLRQPLVVLPDGHGI
mmetsp:Transcript_23918/g.74488  ORF Transcript_23918/g.74488 Transcript_23918/m.74488 type:complete len:206 (-) Transcript_23918:36-653(-)